MTVEWKDGYFHATLGDLDDAIRASGGTLVPWEPDEEAIRTAAVSMAAAVDKAILKRVEEMRRNRPPML